MKKAGAHRLGNNRYACGFDGNGGVPVSSRRPAQAQARRWNPEPGRPGPSIREPTRNSPQSLAGERLRSLMKWTTCPGAAALL